MGDSYIVYCIECRYDSNTPGFNLTSMPFSKERVLAQKVVDGLNGDGSKFPQYRVGKLVRVFEVDTLKNAELTSGIAEPELATNPMDFFE